MQCSLCIVQTIPWEQQLETFPPLKKSRHGTYRLTLVERFRKLVTPNLSLHLVKGQRELL